VDRDHVGGTELCSLGITWEPDTAPPQDAITETEVENGEADLQVKEVLFEGDSTRKGLLQDEVREVEGLRGDHFTSLDPAVGIFFLVAN